MFDHDSREGVSLTPVGNKQVVYISIPIIFFSTFFKLLKELEGTLWKHNVFNI